VNLLAPTNSHQNTRKVFKAAVVNDNEQSMLIVLMLKMADAWWTITQVIYSREKFKVTYTFMFLQNS